MTEITRRKVDIKIERDILTGLIISDKVCKELLYRIDLKIFQARYIAIVCKWIKEYYSEYEKAPKFHIQDIFENAKKKLDKTDSDLIEKILTKLSDEYETLEQFNESYLIDNAIKYIEERNIITLANRLHDLIAIDDIEKAKSAISQFKGVAKSTSGWSNPFSIQEVNESMDFQQDVLFGLPGALGSLLGTDFERGWLIGVLAPVKRGKTWLLLEFAMLAMVAKLKVLFVSLEMRKERMNRRVYKRVASVMNRSTEVIYPCFDCLNNQDDSCDRRERTCNVKLLDDDDNKPDFKDAPIDYKPCTYCRDSKEDDYIAEQWMIVEKRPAFNVSIIRDKVRSLSTTYHTDNFRLKCYPRFSANLSQIISDIDMLDYSEGFIPDVIIIDYADILAPENQYDDTRRMVDETWMTLARLAEERKCLVVTASQSNRKSWNAKNVRGQDVSEDYRKMAHVDIMFTMNQTMQEKLKGRMRIGICAHRDEDFNEFRQVTILQQLGAGQPLIDSEMAEIEDDE